MFLINFNQPNMVANLPGFLLGFLLLILVTLPSSWYLLWIALASFQKYLAFHSYGFCGKPALFYFLDLFVFLIDAGFIFVYVLWNGVRRAQISSISLRFSYFKIFWCVALMAHYVVYHWFTATVLGSPFPTLVNLHLLYLLVPFIFFTNNETSCLNILQHDIGRDHEYVCLLHFTFSLKSLILNGPILISFFLSKHYRGCLFFRLLDVILYVHRCPCISSCTDLYMV